MTCRADDFLTGLQAEIPSLKRYARGLAGTREAGDDLVQTALERALRHRDGFRTGAGMRHWLRAIVRNAFLDEYRKRLRQGWHVPVQDHYRETHLAAPQEFHAELEDVTRRIESLRPVERTVLHLRAYEGLSHDQIALRTGVAVGTVKSRLYRARRALAECG